MRLLHHIIIAGTLGTLGLQACSGENDASNPTDELKQFGPLVTTGFRAYQGDMASAGPVAPVSNNRWRKRGRAKISDSSTPPTDRTQASAGPTEGEIAQWTDADWLAHLRPIAYFDGDEYELNEPDAEYLNRLRSAVQFTRPSGARARTVAAGDNPALTNQFLGGGIKTQQVIGTDDRSWINAWFQPYEVLGVFRSDPYSVGTSRIPTSGLPGSTADREAPCTMTLIGPSTAISSAHCFYDAAFGVTPGSWHPGKTWAFGVNRTTTFVTNYGYNGGGTYQVHLYSGCYWVTIPTAFTTANTLFNDYAVIEFSNHQFPTCNLYPGNYVGYWGTMSGLADQVIRVTPPNLPGYPSKMLSNSTSAGFEWPTAFQHSGVAGQAWISSNNAFTIVHTLDSLGGNSGGPITIVSQSSGNRYIVGINKGSASLPEDTTKNWARRLDSTVMSFISANSDL